MCTEVRRLVMVIIEYLFKDPQIVPLFHCTLTVFRVWRNSMKPHNTSIAPDILGLSLLLWQWTGITKPYLGLHAQEQTRIAVSNMGKGKEHGQKLKDNKFSCKQFLQCLTIWIFQNFVSEDVFPNGIVSSLLQIKKEDFYHCLAVTVCVCASRLTRITHDNPWIGLSPSIFQTLY